MGRAAPGQKSGEEGRPWPQSSLNFFLLWVSPDPDFHVMRIRILLLKIILSSRQNRRYVFNNPGSCFHSSFFFLRRRSLKIGSLLTSQSSWSFSGYFFKDYLVYFFCLALVKET